MEMIDTSKKTSNNSKMPAGYVKPRTYCVPGIDFNYTLESISNQDIKIWVTTQRGDDLPQNQQLVAYMQAFEAAHAEWTDTAEDERGEEPVRPQITITADIFLRGEEKPTEEEDTLIPAMTPNF